MKNLKIKKTRNEGRTIVVNGEKVVIDKVLANGKFRIKQGEGGVVADYSIDDIDSAKELIMEVI